MNRIDPLDLILLLAGKSAVLTISALLAVFAAPSVAQYKALEGTPEKLGTVDFRISCNSDAQRHFTRSVSLYHSYYWPEARKAFSAAAQADPSCAMPHWGHSIVLMGNAFAWPLSGKALKEGLDAVERAKSLEPKTARERDFVASAESFFKDADKIPPRTRQLAYELSLENRFRALSGAARAAELAGDSTRAREYYSQTQKLWADADHESPELSRIKAYLVKN